MSMHNEVTSVIQISKCKYSKYFILCFLYHYFICEMVCIKSEMALFYIVNIIIHYRLAVKALSEKVGESQRALRHFASEHYRLSGYSKEISEEMSKCCVSQRDIQVSWPPSNGVSAIH